MGYSEDSFTPSEFELTEYVKEGENKLAAQVFKWTASSWCEDQDFYRFSGIYRDVYLYTVPEVHVNDLRIRAIPEESLTSATLELVTKTWGSGTLKILLSKDGEVILEDSKEISDEDTFIWAAVGRHRYFGVQKMRMKREAAADSCPYNHFNHCDMESEYRNGRCAAGTCSISFSC